MSTPLTILIAVLVFGFLIFIHEFGHYITARIFSVKIEEFSIGMGPRLLWFTSKKTGIKYSLAILPIGGFVSMPGENGESDEFRDDPNTFGKKPAWQRFIITAAGAAINILFGFVFMLVLTCFIDIGYTTVGGFRSQQNMIEIYDTEESDLAYISTEKFDLKVGDNIISIDGKRVRIADEVVYEIQRRGNEPVDLVVERGGEVITLRDVTFSKCTQMGQEFGVMDFWLAKVDKNPLSVVSYSLNKSVLTVRMSIEAIIDLLTGRYTLAAVSGPVGISSAIGSAAADGIKSLLSMVILISINLGVMNLLPIPALDGGRLATTLIEMVTRKKLPAKVEGIINGVGLALLLGFSFIIMIKDVVQLIIK